MTDTDSDTLSKSSSPPKLSLRILVYETVGFFLLIVWCWFDELFDLPAVLFGGEPSPTNIVEAIEETIVIAIFGAVVVYISYKLLQKIRSLEGIIPTCSFCKKIRVGEDWYRMEEYFSARTDAKFSHGFCDTCLKEHYGISSDG